MELNFYKQPFTRCGYSSHINDARNNFTAQFIPKFDKNGEYAEGWEQLEKDVLESLNSDEYKPLESLRLVSDKGMIRNNGEPFILIRGWGNLTGIGAHNMPADKAAKIQDDFEQWIIYKLSPIN